MPKKLLGQLPAGVKDFLPVEAAQKRVVEDACLKVFRSWGYQEVVTPTFEYYDSLMPGQSQEDDRWYKFLDRQGRLLALRPDMTTPIARLVATRLQNELLPLRLCYISNVFSYEDPQAGRQREFYEAGVEIIGSSKAEADAEVIALAIEALQSVGLDYFQISLNQIDIFNGLMEEIKVSEEDKKKIKAVIGNKDFVGLEKLIYSFDLDRVEQDRILQIMTLRGGGDVFARAKELTTSAKGLAALENLEEVFAILEAQGLAEKIFIDFGLLRGFEYYTGLVFEGYTAGLGFPICGGGRYDRLLGQFGYEVPATGFALGIERVLLALERTGNSPEGDTLDYFVVYPPEQREKALLEAKRLREEGYRVATELVERPLEETAGCARAKGAKNLLAVDDKGEIQERKLD